MNKPTPSERARKSAQRVATGLPTRRARREAEARLLEETQLAFSAAEETPKPKRTRKPKTELVPAD